MRLDAEEKHYIVSWNTGRDGGVPDGSYRITTELEGRALGGVTVYVGGRGGPAGQLFVRSGQTLPSAARGARSSRCRARVAQ